MALESAIRSWLARESLRTRRPNHTLGITMSTSTSKTCSITNGLVQISTPSAPRPSTILRKPMLSEEPTTVCTSVVSADRRESTSPVCVVSKNSGLCCSTW